MGGHKTNYFTNQENSKFHSSQIYMWNFKKPIWTEAHGQEAKKSEPSRPKDIKDERDSKALKIHYHSYGSVS